MRTRDALGLTLAPLFLRLMLAITFLWAGLGKVMEQTTLPPEQAARLANIGGPQPARPPLGAPTRRPTDTAPRVPLNDPNPTPGSLTPPLTPPAIPDAATPPITPPEFIDDEAIDGTAIDPDQGTTTDAPPSGESLRPRFPALAQLGQSGPLPTPTPSTPPNTPSDKQNSPPISPIDSDPAPSSPVPAVVAAPVYTAQDFPDPIQVRKVMQLALMIDAAANPEPNVDGVTPMALWPDRVARKPWPVVFAWAAAITEILAGALLILGLFTRLAALGLAGTMLVAIWLTQIGPAVQQGGANFGFLPAHDTFDIAAWQPFFWQLSLLASSLALFFLGSGPAGLDAAIFGGPGDAAPRSTRRRALQDD